MANILLKTGRKPSTGSHKIVKYFYIWENLGK